MGNRPRMSKITIEEIVHDPEVYGPNSSSDNAKKFHEHNHSFTVEFWLDKHCGYRQTERYGIEINNLQDLAIESLKHIIYYQLRYPKLNFIQYPEYRGRQHRIALKKTIDSGNILNVIIECHFVDINIYEITIVTAMVENNFRHFDGQYVLEVDGESSKLLRRLSNAYTIVSDFK